MSTRMLAILEDAAQHWIESHCEEDDWPEFYVHPELAKQMAAAAYAVFSAAAGGQKYAKSQEA